MTNQIKTKAEIKAIRQSGKILASTLNYIAKHLYVGMKTKEIASMAANELKKLGGTPAFLGYNGFPDVICVSVNEEVVHGIPGDRILRSGDLVGLDFGVIYKGMITDAAITVPIDSINKRIEHLLNVTAESLYIGIDQIKSNIPIGNISAAIEAVLKSGGLGIVKELSGHGVGHFLHEEPVIPNFGQANQGPIIKEGMTLAVEPMATLGNAEIELDTNNWTYKTKDGSLAAHFEHTVLVTGESAEILTLA